MRRMVGDYPDATRRLRRRLDRPDQRRSRVSITGSTSAGRGSARPTAFHIGVMVNPGRREISTPRCGASNTRSRPAPSSRSRGRSSMRQTFERLYSENRRRAGIPILAGLWPFESVHRRRVHGQRSARRARALIRCSSACAARRTGRARLHGNRDCTEDAGRDPGMVQGVHLAAPAGRIDAALAVLDGISASG